MKRGRPAARPLRAVNDPEAQALVAGNIRFAWTIAKPYKSLGRQLGMTWDDLAHEGVLGLYEAATRYRTDRKAKFTSYASFWVRRAIINAMQDRSGTIRIPKDAYQKGVRRIVVGLDEVALPSTKTGKRRVFDPPVAPVALDRLEELERDAALRRILADLSPREAAVLRLRFIDGRKLVECGRMFGVSTEWIRQIQNGAIAKLRDGVTARRRPLSRSA